MSGLVHEPVSRPPQPATAPPVVDIVVPVYNEEADLAASVRRLDDELRGSFPYPYRITVADNASTDGTWQIARALSGQRDTVRAVHLDLKGRGRALKQVWLDSDAQVVAYMDVDLSTDLRALLPLVAPLITGHSDVAIGTRLARASRVVRGPRREVISRAYNGLLHAALGVRFSDAQCGFKAIRTGVARRLLPLVEDTNWFFDTELLVLAQRAGLRIHEVPVDWIDDPGSTVDIVATAREDLLGIWRLARGFATGRIPVGQLRAELTRGPLPAPVAGVPHGMLTQLLSFAAIGVISTLAFSVLYLWLRTPLGAQPANLLSLLITAVANTALNRRLTFGIRGARGVVRHQVGGLAAFGLALALTAGSLVALHLLAPAAGRWVEVGVLFVANALATLLRFLILRLLMNQRPVELSRDAGSR